ncbi:hypothetical protein ACFPOB_21755 [Bosea eneae]|uniref:Uncharacterized protein n=1 Tax=Bosea eneae TaxID=151454 RepID=A0ABW0IY54_9HYPH
MEVDRRLCAFMLGVEVARWAHVSGTGLIGAGLVGLVAGAVAYGRLIVLFIAVRLRTELPVIRRSRRRLRASLGRRGVAASPEFD